MTFCRWRRTQCMREIMILICNSTVHLFQARHILRFDWANVHRFPYNLSKNIPSSLIYESSEWWSGRTPFHFKFQFEGIWKTTYCETLGKYVGHREYSSIFCLLRKLFNGETATTHAMRWRIFENVKGESNVTGKRERVGEEKTKRGRDYAYAIPDRKYDLFSVGH